MKRRRRIVRPDGLLYVRYRRSGVTADPHLAFELLMRMVTRLRWMLGYHKTWVVEVLSGSRFAGPVTMLRDSAPQPDEDEARLLYMEVCADAEAGEFDELLRERG